MAKVNRQKLGASKTRLVKLLADIEEIRSGDTKGSWEEYKTFYIDLKKKMTTFQKHVDEYEAFTAGKGDAEEERFIDEYNSYEEVLTLADELLTKLECVIDISTNKQKDESFLNETKLKTELELKKEELKIASEQEIEKLKIASQEKIALEQIKLENTNVSSESSLKAEASTLLSSSSKSSVGVKLPKYELVKFDEDILRWQEFWDSFESSIHNNGGLNKVDKFNYLKVQLEGKAKNVISGLEITNANYD